MLTTMTYQAPPLDVCTLPTDTITVQYCLTHTPTEWVGTSIWEAMGNTAVFAAGFLGVIAVFATIFYIPIKLVHTITRPRTNPLPESLIKLGLATAILALATLLDGPARVILYVTLGFSIPISAALSHAWLEKRRPKRAMTERNDNDGPATSHHAGDSHISR